MAEPFEWLEAAAAGAVPSKASLLGAAKKEWEVLGPVPPTSRP